MTNTSTLRPQVNRGYSAPALHSTHSSSPTSTTPSSPSSIDSSYFSADAPSTGVSPAISPSSPYISPTGNPANNPTSSDFPIITATVTSRNSGVTSSSHTTTSNSMTASQYGVDPLRQFALHIPAPPMISLGAASRQPVPSIHSPMHASAMNSRLPSTPGYDDLPSPMDRSRRMPPSSQAPRMTVSSTVYCYTFCVKLPAAIQPEMVTVSANRGDKLKVVADAWHMENESHYEWQISFPPRDIDMSAVHARFDAEKNLTIDVRRIPRVYR